MVLLEERYFVNVICNHSILQSYPAIVDCHYRQKASLLESKWDAESIIHRADSTFVGNLSNTLPVGVQFCKMKNSQILWPRCTPHWFSARIEDRLLNTHSQPWLAVGLIMAAWNSLKGENVPGNRKDAEGSWTRALLQQHKHFHPKDLQKSTASTGNVSVAWVFSLLRLVGSF